MTATRRPGILKNIWPSMRRSFPTYRAAKAAMSELLGGAKLPKMDALKKQRRELAEKKKALYAEYRKAQADMREAVAVKGNIDCLLGHTDERETRPRSDSAGAADNRRIAPDFWDKVSRSPAGLGSSPTSIFAGPPATQK